ncbi:MAG: DUF503 domain-containing protein [Dehalococcoidia bacterium]|nr:MAG: DUF503 domain-containing protein [Dehalococcoidia bacterium]
MVTVSVLLTIDIPQSHSLKEKRGVIRPLVERLRTRLHVTAAETGLQERVDAAQVGYAVVSRDAATARAVAEEAHRFAEDYLIGRGEIIDAAIEETVLR